MPFARQIEFARLNESDVRAEVIDPLLRALGYQAGTQNNIERERTLRYDRAFLGRKKATDPIIRGKPDYVLEVGSHGRWLIEVKAPNAPLDIEAFEQAQSYSLHPNVSASVFVLTNGRRFSVYRANAATESDHLLSFSFEEGANFWERLKSLLSPDGFKRNVPQPNFDPREPVAEGFGAKVRIGAGKVSPSDAQFRSNLNVPFDQATIDAVKQMQNPIRRGVCERGENGQIEVKIEFGSSISHLESILKEKGIMNLSLQTNDQFISMDPDRPSLFTGQFSMTAEAGEIFFDIATWQAMPLQLGFSSVSRADALGFIDGDSFRGTYFQRSTIDVGIPGLNMELEIVGDFEMDILG
jgi:hypothetical protein